MNKPVTGQLAYNTHDDGSEESSHKRIALDWIVQAGDWSVFEPLDEHFAQISAVLEHASGLDWPADKCEATIALSDDVSVHALNIKFRNIDKSTNVLSFPALNINSNITDTYFLGDVILASETILHEAEERNLQPAHHLVHLLIHGILHLIGYDHKNAADADIMEKLEIRLLAELGIRDPYTQYECQQQSKETAYHPE